MAMVLVITVLAALLAVGAVLLSLQLNSTRSTSLLLDRRQAHYCAEAGLQMGQAIVPQKLSEWNDVLDGEPFPTWYPLRGDIDGDGTNDYEVTIEDNVDESGSLANDPERDNDLSVLVISKCIKWPNSIPKTLMTLVKYQVGTGACDSMQKGAGCQGTSNLNR